MSSPSEKLMASMRAKRDAMCTYKAVSSLPKGQIFDITEFSRIKSIYENADKVKPHVLVAHFSYAGINMKTYLPGEFSDSSEEIVANMVDTFNSDLKKGVRIKFAFYGNMAQQNIVKLHFNDEDIDTKKLMEIEEWQKKTEESPAFKRQRMDQGSPNYYNRQGQDFSKSPAAAKRKLMKEYDQ